jgi:hypothetical protein
MKYQALHAADMKASLEIEKSQERKPKKKVNLERMTQSTVSQRAKIKLLQQAVQKSIVRELSNERKPSPIKAKNFMPVKTS